MMTRRIIYLDNAATTFPKPEGVIRAVEECMRYRGGNPGRSSHSVSVAAAQTVYSARAAIASMCGAEPERVAFTLNATYALNLAIKGLVRPYSHVVISNIEHNSVLRPVSSLSSMKTDYSLFDVVGKAQGDTEGVLASLKSALRGNTGAVVVCHRSNTLPVEAPLEAIGELCRKKGLTFIVDASQSFGCVETDIEKCGISALCAPFHKGLYGPQGGGFAAFGKSVSDREIRTIMQGGSGSASSEVSMPGYLPERLEAGTVPTPAIAGALAGAEFVKRQGASRIDRYERELVEYMKKRLSRFDKVKVYFPERSCGGILLFNAEGFSGEELAAALDKRGICVRSGLHCSPLSHRVNNTLSCGAVRVSVSAFNSYSDVDAFADSLSAVLSLR